MSTPLNPAASTCCVYCKKACKTSDSRPFPNSRSTDRIHNKCQIKKNLDDKAKQKSHIKHTTNIVPSEKLPSISDSPKIMTLYEKAAQEELEVKKAETERKLSKLVAERVKEASANSSKNSFFFDLKAGIAKPHEKRRYLHHRNVSEIATRYDDNGFHQETVGRAYDHTGNDLDSPGDCSDTEDAIHDTQKPAENVVMKRANNDSLHPKCKATKRIRLDEKNPCWFCLSSPSVEKHLIITIGEYCYLALAKGGLTDDHLLLIPVDHIESLNDTKNNPQDLLEELELFKKSLVAYFGDKGQAVVFFERYFKSVHWQLQVVPVPNGIADDLAENIKSISKKHFSNSNFIDIPSACSLSDVVPQKAPYFYWQIEPLGRRLVSQIHLKGSFFPVQLGRMTLADTKILDCPEKIDWKRCVKTDVEYTELVKQIRQTYKAFDFT